MSAKAAPGGAKLGGEPRVQLLPPIVRERAKMRATRRLMVMIVILAAIAAGAATGLSFLAATQSEAALAAEQARTAQLLEEQARYSEGARVANLVGATEQAKTAVIANEVAWAELLDTLETHFPEGMRYYSLDLLAPPPWEPQALPAGDLRDDHVIAATIGLTTGSSSYANAARFAESAYGLEQEDGLADVVIQSILWEPRIDSYVVTFSLTYTPDARVDRFAVDEEPEEDPDAEVTDEKAADESAAATPPATPTPEVTP